jgi:hypothetical protein
MGETFIILRDNENWLKTGREKCDNILNDSWTCHWHIHESWQEFSAVYCGNSGCAQQECLIKSVFLCLKYKYYASIIYSIQLVLIHFFAFPCNSLCWHHLKISRSHNFFMAKKNMSWENLFLHTLCHQPNCFRGI